MTLTPAPALKTTIYFCGAKRTVNAVNSGAERSAAQTKPVVHHLTWTTFTDTVYMRCAYPRETARGKLFPCQQCMPCRINKRRKWTARLLLEAACHPSSLFLTLTYDEANVPKTASGIPQLDPEDLKLYWKRLRKAGLVFRYFAVGEYGERTARPHYHAILYGLDETAEKTLLEKWPFGFIKVDADVNPKVAAYCCGYVLKKWTQKEDPRLKGRHPEFMRSSRRPGIGANAIERLSSVYETSGGSLVLSRDGNVRRVFRMDGRIWPLDRFMLQKLREELGLPEKAIDRPDEGIAEQTEEETMESRAQVERLTRRWKKRGIF